MAIELKLKDNEESQWNLILGSKMRFGSGIFLLKDLNDFYLSHKVKNLLKIKRFLFLSGYLVRVGRDSGRFSTIDIDKVKFMIFCKDFRELISKRNNEANPKFSMKEFYKISNQQFQDLTEDVNKLQQLRSVYRYKIIEKLGTKIFGLKTNDLIQFLFYQSYCKQYNELIVFGDKPILLSDIKLWVMQGYQAKMRISKIKVGTNKIISDGDKITKAIEFLSSKGYRIFKDLTVSI